MQPQTLNLDRSFWWAVGLLAAIVLAFEMTNLDLWAQDQLFDFERQTWLIDKEEPVGKWLFYTGPKLVIIFLGVVMLAAATLPHRWLRRLPGVLRSRHNTTVVFLSLALTPALIGWSKAVTNMFCPSEIQRYGGAVKYVRLFDTYPVGEKPLQQGRCFPAGHASGGFALFALAGLANERRSQLLGVATGLAVGSLMGFYQMAKGAHYLSHTLITALIAWVVFSVLHAIAKNEAEHSAFMARLRALVRRRT